jgi:hypothetical protein
VDEFGGAGAGVVRRDVTGHQQTTLPEAA